MKKIFLYFLSLLLLAGTSCTDVLDQQAVDSFDEDVVFSDINLVKAYVGACYSMIGSTKQDNRNSQDCPLQKRDMLTSSTDHTLNCFRNGEERHLKGNLSPDNLGTISNRDNGKPWLYWSYQYLNIQNLNTIISRIDEVPVNNTAEEALRTRLKGEAYFLRALSYTHLLLMHGGVILSDRPYRMDDDFSLIRRSSIETTKNFILADIDEAMAHLPKKGDPLYEQGRASQGAAAAVKSRMLLFCASKLTNGGWAEQADNELVSFPAGSQRSLLEAARDAAKDIMDGNYGTYALVGNTSAPALPLTEEQAQQYADNFFNIFYQKIGSAWNSETIWGIQHPEKDGRSFQPSMWSGPNGNYGYGNNSPTEELVRKFEMADGTKFVWDTATPDDKFTERKATAAELQADPFLNPYYGREPRFYASLLYHGAPWIERSSAGKIYDPLNRIQSGDKHRLRYNSDTGETETTVIIGVDRRGGPIYSGNGTKTGYYLKKYLDPELPADLTETLMSTHTWIEYRFAEVLLNYAEACIELGGTDLQPGIDAMNLVRHRAGLPSRVTTNQNEAREFVRHEREIELFGEGIRFWDIRKWMICDEVIIDVYQMVVKEFIDGDDNDEFLGMSWQLSLDSRQDERTWAGDHFYWYPIPRGEITKVPGLQQNPVYQ